MENQNSLPPEVQLPLFEIAPEVGRRILHKVLHEYHTPLVKENGDPLDQLWHEPHHIEFDPDDFIEGL